MKKVIVLLVVMLSLASAEILVMGVDLDVVEKHYIRVNIAGSLGTKLYVYVDYGQGGLSRNHVVINRTGGKRVFESEIDVLNLFYENGWEIKTAITEPSGGSEGSSISGDTYYILERMDRK
jgi:hypothetical protein